MRWEIVNLIEKLEEQSLIKAPIFDIGGNGTAYQKEQGYNFKDKYKAKNMDYYIADILPNEGVDFVLDATQPIFVHKDSRPNTIFLTEMLEHVKDPAAVMRNCWQLLKNDGVIIVTVPDMYGIHCAEDYFRFTENGTKMLCSQFEQIQYGDFGTEEKRNLEHFFVGRKVATLSGYPLKEKGDLNGKTEG